MLPCPLYDRIVLTGFMGSGKSTLGALMAKEIGWAFVDLDREIERREQRSVPQIFAESGESAFRTAETAALVEGLKISHAVIALGGGAPEEAANRTLLAQAERTAVVYLAAGFAILTDRCRAQAEDAAAIARPNFADEALAAARFERRHPHYQSVATHTFDTTTHSQQACAVDLLRLLGRSASREATGRE
jgi:shikimate kinase